MSDIFGPNINIVFLKAGALATGMLDARYGQEPTMLSILIANTQTLGISAYEFHHGPRTPPPLVDYVYLSNFTSFQLGQRRWLSMNGGFRWEIEFAMCVISNPYDLHPGLMVSHYSAL